MSVSNVPGYGHIRRGPMTADVLGHDFTQSGNRAVRDRRLSRRAKGLLVELLSHRDGYGISIPSLVAAGPEGRDAIRTALAELEEHGYLVRKRERREDGTLGGTQYYITDMPDPVEQQNGRSEPATEKPTLDEPTLDEPTLVDRLHKKTIPLEDQLEEDHLSLPSVPDQRTVASERENLAAPDPTTTTTAASSVADPVAATTPPHPHHTDSQQQGQQQPQDASQPPVAADPAPSPADAVVEAYTAALGRPATRATLERIHGQAAELLTDDTITEAWLADRARELAANGWSDLAKHVERCPVPLPGAGPTAAASGMPPWCGRCGTDYGPAAEHNPRFRRLDDGALCHCHPDNIPTWSSGGHQPYRNPVDHSIYELDFDGRPLPGTDTRVAGWNALAGQLGGQPRPSTTDARVQAALDLGRQMQAEYDAAQAVADGQDDEPGDGQDTVDDAELVDDDPSDGWQLMRQMIHANRVKRGTAR